MMRFVTTMRWRTFSATLLLCAWLGATVAYAQSSQQQELALFDSVQSWPPLFDPEHGWTLRGQDDSSFASFSNDASEPDISDPGPDFGDFPNSAATLKRGRSYIEQAPFTLLTKDHNSPAAYAWPFLLRYGVTDNVEFRLISSGLVSVLDPRGTTGLAPLILDMKIHLWDDRMERLQPAASLEVTLQTTWGSPAFAGGTQPGLNLNLDFPFTEKTNLEMTFGYTGAQDAVKVATGERFFPRFHFILPVVHRANLNVNQFSYQWAVEQQVTERFQLFTHGFFNGPIYLQTGSGVLVGAGYFYQISQRWMIFNSYNAGCNKTVPPFSTQFGMAVAY